MIASREAVFSRCVSAALRRRRFRYGALSSLQADDAERPTCRIMLARTGSLEEGVPARYTLSIRMRRPVRKYRPASRAIVPYAVTR